MQHAAVQVLGPHRAAHLVEVLHGLQVPGDGRVEDVVAPLVVGDPQRLRVVGRPGDVHLQDHRLALPAALAERGDDPLEPLARLVDRRQAVRPAPDPARGLGRHRGPHERRRLGGQRPQPRAVDVDEAVVGDLLPREHRADDRDALGQARVALGLGGQRAPVMCSLDASPVPRQTHRRRGNISASVAMAWATIAGW
jgi:hypothetical protein